MASKKKKQRVYLACRAIFSGDRSLLRKKKLVRKEIQDHKHALGSLSDISVDEVVEIAVELLEQKIFESEPKAKLKFPTLFQSTQERDALREASELEAAQSVADILEAVTDGEDNEVSPEVDEGLPIVEEYVGEFPICIPISLDSTPSCATIVTT